MTRIRRKKILAAVFVVILIIFAGMLYLNNVYLPTKVKSLIINTLQDETGRQVSLGEVKLHLFKGLLLRDLKIYDGKDALISLKEGSCGFLILPIFKKKIIIPFVRLDSLAVSLVREKDSSFNLGRLFLNKSASGKPSGGFSVLCYRISVKGGLIRFRDNTPAEPFVKNIENLNLSLYLSLPANVKFSLKANIPGKPPANISATGNFKIPQRQLNAKIALGDISPKEFLPYYRDSGVNIPAGLLNALTDLQLEDRVLQVNSLAQCQNITFIKDGISAVLNTEIESNLRYSFQDKQAIFSGKARLTDSKFSFLLFPGVIQDIKGELSFNNAGISTDKLTADIWEIPVEIKGRLDNFSDPFLNIDLACAQSLSVAQDILKDKFKITLPGSIKGASSLSLNLRTVKNPQKALEVSGSLSLLDAWVKLEKLGYPFEEVNGKIEFSRRQLKWQDLDFKYLSAAYKSWGSLIDFKAPQVRLGLSSKDLNLESVFALNNKLLTLSELSGRYLNSEFSLSGEVNNAQAGSPMADLSGILKVNLEDLGTPFKKLQKPLEKIKLRGLVDTQFTLSGNINRIKGCAIAAKFSGASLSAYGFKSGDFSINYSQAGGIANISPMRLSLYDGVLEANAGINLNSESLPYWVALDIQGVRLEKMKPDAAEKDKGIAGNLQAQAKINGFSSDLARLSGAGKIKISEGRLWQLDLFKGLGSLIFIKDFANIVFHEGSCGFIIRDKYISTDDLTLKSPITNLVGSVKLGFDTSIDATLNVEVLDENVPLSGTFKDITTAIIGEAGRFGVIKISGTLKEPKYKFQTAVAVTDIIKGLTDILGKQIDKIR